MRSLCSFMDCSCPFPSGCNCCYFSFSFSDNSAFGMRICKLSYRFLQLPCKLKEDKHLLPSKCSTVLKAAFYDVAIATFFQ